jgi:hypothetical protein
MVKKRNPRPRWQRLSMLFQTYALIFVFGLSAEQTDWKASFAGVLIATSLGLCYAGWLDKN